VTVLLKRVIKMKLNVVSEPTHDKIWSRLSICLMPYQVLWCEHASESVVRSTRMHVRWKLPS